MSAQVTFTGSQFSLESVSATGQATIRVRFTQDPLAVSGSGANDALNINNYVLSGPGINAISSAGTVFGDPQAIDLFLVGPLTTGTWTLAAAAGIHETDGSALQLPRTLQFQVSLSGSTENASMGAENDDEEDILRKHLNPALKGLGWTSLIAAIATGEKKNRDNAALAFDQLFKISASGIYLERRAADDGTKKPPNIGMSDELFRQFAIKTTNGKLVENSLLDILEIFYGSDSVRAHCDTALSDTYFLQDGDSLTVLLDEQVSVITFLTSADFAIIGKAQAAEVAAALTRSFRFNGSKAYAVAITDPQTGANKVRIYSGSLGLGSSVRVTAGKAQNVLQFSDKLDIVSGLPTWVISFDAASGRTRFTTASNTVDLSKLAVGDYVNVFGAVFNAADRGSFPVVNVFYAYPGGTLTQYFEVLNLGTPQTVTQINQTDILYFRPTRKTIHTTVGQSVIVSSLNDEVEIVLPATSQAVVRGKDRAAYGQVNDALILTNLERKHGVVSATTSLAHGMAVGDQFVVDNVFGADAVPPTTNGSYIAGSGTSDFSQTSIWSKTAGTKHANAGQGGTAVRLLDGRVFHAHGIVYTAAVASIVPKWNVFSITGIADMAGAKQATFVDLDAVGAASNSPHLVAYASASLGIAPGWFFGAVLVTGGATLPGYVAQNTVGIYAPGTLLQPGTYTNHTTTLITAREGHFQITLNKPGQPFHGGFLVTGGADTGGIPMASCERFSPVEGTAWANVAPMNTARSFHQGVVLKDGRVLVVGGDARSSCEIYDPVANTWVYTGSMSYVRIDFRIVLLNDGRVMAVGGLGYNPTQSSTYVPVLPCEIWDPRTGRWTPAGTLKFPHDLVVAEYLSSQNKVVVTGGSDVVYGIKTEIYDVAKGIWTVGPAMIEAARPGAVSALCGDSECILMVGGYDPTITSASYANLYIPNSDTVLSGAINDFGTVASVVSPTTFKFNTPRDTDYTLNASTIATVTPLRAKTSTIPGPFIYDTKGGVAVTGIETNILTSLNQGQRYGSVEVANAFAFPDTEGWLCFSFGFENQVAPVKYLGRLSDTTLAIDYGFKFPKTVPAGATVTLLFEKGIFVPDHPEQVGSFYITASPAGRIAASTAIDDAVGAGIVVNKSITYPGDRGLAGAGLPSHGSNKLSDEVTVWGSDDMDGDLAAAREE